ncbi:hypothetical protein GOP47_0023195, partial [Adiantum capillus-veneris]
MDLGGALAWWIYLVLGVRSLQSDRMVMGSSVSGCSCWFSVIPSCGNKVYGFLWFGFSTWRVVGPVAVKSKNSNCYVFARVAPCKAVMMWLWMKCKALMRWFLDVVDMDEM